MGQQQLLLVILVTIIVGIATVVAINTFSSAADSANVDAVRNDITQIASSAQSYYMKPDMMGGGGNSFTGLTFNKIAFGSDSTFSDTKVSNANGTYVISPSASSLTITAYPSSNSGYTPGSTSGNSLVANVVADDMSYTDNDPTN